MRSKLRGAPKQREKRESFIRLRPDESSRLEPMGGTTGSEHLRSDQILRAQEVVQRLKDQFGSLSALERASTKAGHRLKQQTMSVLLNNNQCGYRIAQTIMSFAATLREFDHLPSNYILEGAEGGAGTNRAPHYALRAMKYRAKGELLDRLSTHLSGDFLDFTAERDPTEPDADKWSGPEWFEHVSREFHLWKLLQENKNRGK